MAEKVRVGYMGIPHSNSEHMAKSFSDGLGLTDYELVPLMSAKNVMDALVSGEIDYGVFATMNRYAGTVVETTTAMKGHSDIETMGSMWTHIHHCAITHCPQLASADGSSCQPLGALPTRGSSEVTNNQQEEIQT